MLIFLPADPCIQLQDQASGALPDGDVNTGDPTVTEILQSRAIAKLKKRLCSGTGWNCS